MQEFCAIWTMSMVEQTGKVFLGSATFKQPLSFAQVLNEERYSTEAVNLRAES